MQKMTFVFLIIIFLYLLYSLIISRFSKKEDKEAGVCREGNMQPQKKEENCEMQRAAIAAVIAAVMGDVPYAVKRVYAVATIDESRSNWRTAGRTEIMTKKVF